MSKPSYTTGPAPALAVPATRPRKKRRVFLWIFLAVQVIFLAILINYAVASTMPTHAEVLAQCSGNSGWQVQYATQAKCIAAHGGLIGINQAAKALAVTMTFVAWCIVDFLLAVPYGIYRLCKR